MRASTTDLMRAIGRLLDTDRVGTVKASARHTLHDQMQEARIEVDIPERSWTITYTSGLSGIDTYSPATGSTLTLPDGRVERSDSSVPPPVIALLFPLTLPIWGRVRDGWLMNDVRYDSTSFTVDLADKETGESAGSLTYSTDRAIPVKYERRTLDGVVLRSYEIFDIEMPFSRRPSQTKFLGNADTV